MIQLKNLIDSLTGLPEKLLQERRFWDGQTTHTDEELADEMDMPGHRLEGFTQSESDVEKAIADLKNEKSTGIDGISSNLVKRIPNTFAKILTLLLNLPFKMGIFPEVFEKSMIQLVFRSDKKLQVRGKYEGI